MLPIMPSNANNDLYLSSPRQASVDDENSQNSVIQQRTSVALAYTSCNLMRYHADKASGQTAGILIDVLEQSPKQALDLQEVMSAMCVLIDIVIMTAGQYVVK